MTAPATYCTQTATVALDDSGLGTGQRIEMCVECRHTHWTTVLDGSNVCDACRNAIIAEYGE
jgi:hypothetical protein